MGRFVSRSRVQEAVILGLIRFPSSQDTAFSPPSTHSLVVLRGDEKRACQVESSTYAQ